MQLTDIFLFLSTLFSLSSMYVYFRILRTDAIRPNPASWTIWVLIGLINVITYILSSEQNIIDSIPLFIFLFGMLVIFIYSLRHGRFAKLNRVDILCLGLAVFTIVIWKTIGNAKLANLILQVVYIVSFIPLFKGILSGTVRETCAPWLLAVCSYGFMTLNCIILLNENNWISLVHPIVNGVLGNGSVVLAIFLYKQRQKLSTA